MIKNEEKLKDFFDICEIIGHPTNLKNIRYDTSAKGRISIDFILYNICGKCLNYVSYVQYDNEDYIVITKGGLETYLTNAFSPLIDNGTKNIFCTLTNVYSI